MVKTMRVGSGTFDHLSNKSPTKRPAEGITILDDIADEERSASRSANMNTFNKTTKSNKQETASTNDLSQQKAMQSLVEFIFHCIRYLRILYLSMNETSSSDFSRIDHS